MKAISQYIYEKKNTFELTLDERRQLGILIGIALGNLGEDADIKQFKKFMDSLSNKEKEDFESLYDTLSNTEDFKKINQKIILSEDIKLLNKFHEYCYYNDIIQDDDWDLINAFEKILNI